MEINDLRITKLRMYLFNIIQTLNEQYKQINVNFLSDDINNYSLDKIPITKNENGWIIGNGLQREVYSFRSRMDYSADTISNIENIGFYEKFEDIIQENNEKNILPEIDGIQSIQCLNSGTMNKANTNTAEFDIQLQIEYVKIENEIISL